MAAEIVMVPFADDDPLVDGSDGGNEGDGSGETCAICGADAERTAYFAKSY